MSRDFNGTSSDTLLHSADILAADDTWTFAAWIKLDAIGALSHTVMSMATDASADNYLKMDVSTTGGLRFRARTTLVSDASVAGVTAGSWLHVACVKRTGDSNRSVYLSGTRGDSTTARAATGMNRTGLGYSPESTGANFLQGLIAYPCWWNTDFSDADITTLAGGANPRGVNAANIVDFMALSGSSPELGDNGSSFTVAGATYSTDEPFSLTGTANRLMLLGVG